MRVLMLPTPEPEDAISSGIGRYVGILERHIRENVEIIHLPGAPHAEDRPREKTAPSGGGHAASRRLWQGWVPPVCRLMAGYVSDTIRLARLIRPFRDKVDLIHVNHVGCEVHTIAAKLAGFSNVVATIHNLPGEGAWAGHWFRRLVERLSFACANQLISVSHATYDAWSERMGLRNDKVTVIHNGMDVSKSELLDKPEARRRLHIPECAVVFGICARLHPMKGHGVLLEAFARLVKEYNDHDGVFIQVPPRNSAADTAATTEEGMGEEIEREAPVVTGVSPVKTDVEKDAAGDGGYYKRESEAGGRTSCAPFHVRGSDEPRPPEEFKGPSLLLLIAGDGPEQGNIESQIKELGLTGHVRMLGRIRDVMEFMRALDVHVLPSVTLESLPFSVVEAMFAGVPSIVSDVGGAKEIVQAANGGVVVPKGDVGALKTAMRMYSGDKEGRRDAGWRSADYAKTRMTGAIMAHETLVVYKKAMRMAR